MKSYTPFEYCLINLGTKIHDSDKEDFELRLTQGLEAIQSGDIYNVEFINKVVHDTYQDDPDAKYELIAAIEGVKSVLQSKPVGTVIRLDMCSSGPTNIGLLYKDAAVLRATGAIDSEKPGNLYNILKDNLNQKCNTNYPKKVVKKATVAYNYGSDQVVKEQFGEGFSANFSKVYEEQLPSCKDFRLKMLDAWDETAQEYYFLAIDSFTVWIPVICEGKETTIETAENGRKRSIKYTHRKMGTKLKGEDKTRGLGAHVGHALDAYELREVNRMCAKSQAWAKEQLAKFKIVSEPNITDEKVLSLFNMFKLTNIATSRWFYLVEKMDTLEITQELYNKLSNICNYMPTKGFKILNVHDEFGCSPNNVNDMRKAFAFICAEIYQGNYLSYISKTFKTNLVAKEYNQEVYDAILNSNFILS